MKLHIYINIPGLGVIEMTSNTSPTGIMGTSLLFSSPVLRGLKTNSDSRQKKIVILKVCPGELLSCADTKTLLSDHSPGKLLLANPLLNCYNSLNLIF